MTNTLKLKAAMAENGKTQADIARLLGLSTAGYFKKLHNQSEFRADEIIKLCRFLNIKDKDPIFFAHNVDL